MHLVSTGPSRDDLELARSVVVHHLRRLVPDTDDLEDLAQDCLLKFWTRQHTIRDRSKIVSWLNRLARNEFVSWLRKRDSRKRSHAEWTASLALERPGPAQAIENKIFVDRVLAEVSETDRQILRLRFFEGMCSDEISRTLGLAPSTARCRIMRLRSRLRSEVLS